MGSCVSSHKNPHSSMKMGFSADSKVQNLLVQSPINEKPIKGENPNAEFNSNSMKSSLPFDLNAANPNIGTKEEAFFDSQAWLDSDCEDDFLSVNGDYTPSGSSTPNHQRNIPGTPQLNEVSFIDRFPNSKLDSSPADKKMRLSELFKESLQEERVTNDDQNAINDNLGVSKTHLEICRKSLDKTSCVSRGDLNCSTEKTPNIDPKQEKEKTLKATQCCLPSFVHSLSFSERKKQQAHTENNTI